MFILEDKDFKIKELRKKLNSTEDKNILLRLDLQLEDLVLDKSKRIYLNQIITCVTNLCETKRLNIGVVIKYGTVKIPKSKILKLNRILEQIVHQLEYTTVCLTIDIHGAANVDRSAFKNNSYILFKNYKSILQEA